MIQMFRTTSNYSSYVGDIPVINSYSKALFPHMMLLGLVKCMRCRRHTSRVPGLMEMAKMIHSHLKYLSFLQFSRALQSETCYTVKCYTVKCYTVKCDMSSG